MTKDAQHEVNHKSIPTGAYEGRHSNKDKSAYGLEALPLPAG
jgi:hypothetical protein